MKNPSEMNSTHGGDIAGFIARYGAPPLDFSASLGPLGMPEGIRHAIHDAVDSVSPYPDPWCRTLRRELAAYHGVDTRQVFIANGAADAIFRLVLTLRPRRVLMPVPAFSEYGQALRLVGAEVVEHVLRPEDDFRIRYDFLDRIGAGVDAVFLCQPGNPVGEVIRPDVLMALLDRTEQCDIPLVVDECFVDFLDDPSGHSLLGRLRDARRLYILKSFTKLYSIAGIRLGYCLGSDPAVLDAMRDAGQPWAVSTLAEAAGRAALREEAFVKKTRDIVRQERARLIECLGSLGFTVWGSRANFVFFHTERTDLVDGLARHGILIRDCRNFAGLRPGYYRVAVRVREENDRLVTALSAIFREDEKGATWPEHS